MRGNSWKDPLRRVLETKRTDHDQLPEFSYYYFSHCKVPNRLHLNIFYYEKDRQGNSIGGGISTVMQQR